MQDFLVLLIVATAAGYLLRRLWQRVAGDRAGSCGSCSGCSSAGGGQPLPLVSISLPREQAKAP